MIIIVFDKPIATASLSTCAALFSTELASLGSKPSCTWSDSRHLEISPDVDANIKPGHTLTFKTDVIKRDQLFSKVLNQTMTIAAPDNPVTPAAVIVG